MILSSSDSEEDNDFIISNSKANFDITFDKVKVMDFYKKDTLYSMNELLNLIENDNDFKNSQSLFDKLISYNTYITNDIMLNYLKLSKKYNFINTELLYIKIIDRLPSVEIVLDYINFLLHNINDQNKDINSIFQKYIKSCGLYFNNGYLIWHEYRKYLKNNNKTNEEIKLLYIEQLKYPSSQYITIVNEYQLWSKENLNIIININDFERIIYASNYRINIEKNLNHNKLLWLQYINNEIKVIGKTQYDYIIALFDRLLIKMCNYDILWLKYLHYLMNHNNEIDRDNQDIINILYKYSLKAINLCGKKNRLLLHIHSILAYLILKNKDEQDDILQLYNDNKPNQPNNKDIYQFITNILFHIINPNLHSSINQLFINFNQNDLSYYLQHNLNINEIEFILLLSNQWLIKDQNPNQNIKHLNKHYENLLHIYNQNIYYHINYINTLHNNIDKDIYYYNSINILHTNQARNSLFNHYKIYCLLHHKSLYKYIQIILNQYFYYKNNDNESISFKKRSNVNNNLEQKKKKNQKKKK